MATGLTALHQRLCELARTLRQRYRLSCEIVYVDDGSSDLTLAIARGLSADSLDDVLRNALAHSSLKDAVAQAVELSGRPRREVYARALALAKEMGDGDGQETGQEIGEEPGQA